MKNRCYQHIYFCYYRPSIINAFTLNVAYKTDLVTLSMQAIKETKSASVARQFANIGSG